MYFLHERSKYLMTQQAIQVILTTVYVVFASPIAGAITPKWWYGLGAVLSAVLFVLAALFLPETKYDRPLSSYQEATEHSFDVEETVNKASPSVTLCTTRPELDFARYAPRTFRSDLRLWVGKPDMKAVLNVYKVRDKIHLRSTYILTHISSKCLVCFSSPTSSGLFASTV